MLSPASCPSCGSNHTEIFYEVLNIPVHSVLVLRTRDQALNYPRGSLKLAFCRDCGFISNTAFDPAVQEYSEQCEETQAFSPTFNSFHHRLAGYLISRYDLHHKRIIEIGCGKGEFLALLCEQGQNEGIGFDPAYMEGRLQSTAQERLAFIKDFYSEKYAHYRGDFYCCKMTLEHIPDVSRFIRTLRNAIGDHLETKVFFQVPDVTRVLREQAFWDIYYEHCSYFSPTSLAHLFRSCGFEIADLWRDYDDQYLMIEARPNGVKSSQFLPADPALQLLFEDLNCFIENYPKKIENWRRRLSEIQRAGRKVVLWGSGSKGVAFLTTLNVRTEIEYTVDINPHKHWTFMAGTGQQVVPPSFLQEYQPHYVIIMNPVYRNEIQADLEKMGLYPEIISIEA